MAVNGQHWREMRRVVQEAGVGTPLVYTVERGDQTLQIAVPTMEFTPSTSYGALHSGGSAPLPLLPAEAQRTQRIPRKRGLCALRVSAVKSPGAPPILTIVALAKWLAKRLA
ncbi:MAG TPA: hypothetical protein ENK08_02480 [Chloroflexi bacterium]|nr:hypothetical protein [Chloroflexota bacterium]